MLWKRSNVSRAVRELSVLVLAASLSTTGCSRVAAKSEDAATAEIPVRAARAAIQDVPLEIAAAGNVEAINSVDVKSRVAGPIARVAFAEGENVTKGQLLFTIDRSMMDRQAAEEQALVERDSALEEQAQATVARDAASARQSRSEADVAVQLGQLGVLSGQRVDEMTTARDTAGAGLASDKASLAAAQSALKADRARLAQTRVTAELQQCDRSPLRARRRRSGEDRQYGSRQRHHARYALTAGSHRCRVRCPGAVPGRGTAVERTGTAHGGRDPAWRHPRSRPHRVHRQHGRCGDGCNPP